MSTHIATLFDQLMADFLATHPRPCQHCLSNSAHTELESQHLTLPQLRQQIASADANIVVLQAKYEPQIEAYKAALSRIAGETSIVEDALTTARHRVEFKQLSSTRQIEQLQVAIENKQTATELFGQRVHIARLIRSPDLDVLSADLDKAGAELLELRAKAAKIEGVLVEQWAEFETLKSALLARLEKYKRAALAEVSMPPTDALAELERLKAFREEAVALVALEIKWFTDNYTD